MNQRSIRRAGARPMPLLPSPLLASSAEAALDLVGGDGADGGSLDDLRCPICFALMLQPRLLPGCSAGGGVRHSFCGPCIVFWLQMQRDAGLPPTCPIDRRVVGADEQPAVDAATEAAVRRQRVHCPNRRLGCAET